MHCYWEGIGKISNLINNFLHESLYLQPSVLNDILRNMPFHLPDNYELLAGTKWENIHLYYDLVKVAMVRNSHNIKMIMSIPLRTANQHFTLHKLIVLPTRISEDKIIKYFPNFLILDFQSARLHSVKGNRCATVHHRQPCGLPSQCNSLWRWNTYLWNRSVFSDRARQQPT